MERPMRAGGAVGYAHAGPAAGDAGARAHGSEGVRGRPRFEGQMQDLVIPQ
jgi:hypothetical protein